jgi:hypothetical protein
MFFTHPRPHRAPPHKGAHRVKPAAAAGVAAFLRSARRDRQRTEAYARCVRELARGRGCWARLGFLEFAAAAARRFSARFFKVWGGPGGVRGWSQGQTNSCIYAVAARPSTSR